MNTHTIIRPPLDGNSAYVSNGVVGVRLGVNPLLSGTLTVSGYVGEHPVETVEGWEYAPYPLQCDLALNGAWLSGNPEAVRFIEQSYDFSCGELTTRFEFAAGGVTAQVEVLNFCSRSLPTLTAQLVSIEVDVPCEVTLLPGVRTGEIPGRYLRHDEGVYTKRRIVDGSLLWESPGALSQVGLAYSVLLIGDGEPRIGQGERTGDGLFTTHRISAQPGKTYRLQQIASALSTLMHHEPDRQAIRMANLGMTRGFEALREENRALWREIWKGRPILIGAEERWQEIADAAFFYLQTSIHPSAPNSTGLFGVGRWHN